MGWKTKVLIVCIKYRNKDLGGAEIKLLDSYLGKWVQIAADDCSLIPADECRV